MGKRQHQKDKLYLTYTEWTTLYGGKVSGERSSEEENAFRRLPFDHCSLSLQPWEHPYCDQDGNIFDLQALIPFLKKFKINPVTGKPLETKTLIKLNFYKNAENELHCPVLFRTLTKHSHIATVATTGNVYSMEAVEQLNIKNKNWKDLITDKPFERKDIIVLQDPTNLGKFNISTFHHVKNNLRIETEEELANKSDPTARLKSINPETKYTLEELNRDYKEPTIELNKKQSTEKADKFNAAHYSTGKVAAGFTSTVMAPELVHEPAIIHEDLVRYERVKKKGYVRLVTNFGPLNLELYCDVVPKTCENFIKLSANGYYNGTKFHRSIRNFMIQGGDPTNTGRGGKSIWGKKFEDEFKQNLSHTGRGVLSMANSGPNTNASQFFITYRSCKHLDNKHTIFGKVVGGMDTLSEIERIEVDNQDRPIEDIILIKAQVFVDPYEEADEQMGDFLYLVHVKNAVGSTFNRSTNQNRTNTSDMLDEVLVRIYRVHVKNVVGGALNRGTIKKGLTPWLSKERQEELTRQREEEAAKKAKAQAQKSLTVYKNGIGKYISPTINKSNKSVEDEEPGKKKKKSESYNFNFSSW